MIGHGGSSAGSYLADPTSPIPSHCASIVVTSTVRVKKFLSCHHNEDFSWNTFWITQMVKCPAGSIHMDEIPVMNFHYLFTKLFPDDFSSLIRISCLYHWLFPHFHSGSRRTTSHVCVLTHQNKLLVSLAIPSLPFRLKADNVSCLCPHSSE